MGSKRIGCDLMTERACKKLEIKIAMILASVSCGGFMMAKNFLTLRF